MNAILLDIDGEIKGSDIRQFRLRTEEQRIDELKTLATSVDANATEANAEMQTKSTRY